MRFCFTTVMLSIILTPIIFAQIDESWKVYDDSEVALIEIIVDSSDLRFMYDYPLSDSVHPATFHFKNALIDETVDSIGIRIRGNTSRESKKKSFKIDFNEFVKGRRFHSLKSLNLNGEHNDPSVIRSKIAWNLYQKIGMKSSRASHAAVYINGNYYGLYISVEHIDDEFLNKNFSDDSGNLWKCLYPADLVYKGENPDLYKNLVNEKRPYELKTNEDSDNYFPLAKLISILNTTLPNVFRDSIEKVLNVTSVLKAFAVDILTGSWDNYWFLKNNYYLYHEPSTNTFYWVPYDYDNTFGISWFNVDWTSVNPYTFAKIDNSARPLATKLLAIPEYKNLFTHLLDFYSKNIFSLELLEDEIDDLRTAIRPYILNDPYYPQDYNFHINDFDNSYSLVGYDNQHVKRGLKEFISKRNNSLSTQLTWVDAAPFIYSIDWTPKYPGANDTVYFTVSGFSKVGLKDVSLNLTNNFDSTEVDFSLAFQPVPNTTKVEEADRWTGKIPPLGYNFSGEVRISALDNNLQERIFPRGRNITIKTPATDISSVLINEFLASNDSLNPDQDNEYDDWTELYNNSSEKIELTGKFLTDNPSILSKWKFPANTSIEPNGYLLIWCDKNSTQQGLHTNFKLDADGEFIALTDIDGITILDSLTFGKQKKNISYGRYPDGSNRWEFLYPSPSGGNTLTSIKIDNNKPENFSLSAYPNPFNPSVTIQYSIPANSEVSIFIYDILGREIFSKYLGKNPAGTYKFKWNGGDAVSGIYICRVSSQNNEKTIKLLLMK